MDLCAGIILTLTSFKLPEFGLPPFRMLPTCAGFKIGPISATFELKFGPKIADLACGIAELEFSLFGKLVWLPELFLVVFLPPLLILFYSLIQECSTTNCDISYSRISPESWLMCLCNTNKCEKQRAVFIKFFN